MDEQRKYAILFAATVLVAQRHLNDPLCFQIARLPRACADLIHLLGSRDRAHFEKLATAAASVSQTSNTVSSLVICRTSWHLLPRWHRHSDAPRVFPLYCAATNV